MNQEVKTGIETLFYVYRSKLIRDGVCAESLKSRMYRVRLLGQFLTESGCDDAVLGVKDAGAFYRMLVSLNRFSSGTRRHIMSEVRCFYDYLVLKGLVFLNPFTAIRVPDGEHPLPKMPLREEQMGEFLGTLATFMKHGEGLLDVKRRYQAHVVAEFLYATGARIGEAALVRMQDIDLEKGEVWIRSLKHGQDRMCFLNDYAKAVLKLYQYEIRPLLAGGKRQQEDLFFCSGKGSITRSITPVLSAALGNSVSCHTFRHAVGAHLLRAGCDIRYIQDVLGHKRLSTTQIYTKLEKEDVKKMLDTYHPRTLKRKS